MNLSEYSPNSKTCLSYHRLLESKKGIMPQLRGKLKHVQAKDGVIYTMSVLFRILSIPAVSDLGFSEWSLHNDLPKLRV